MYLKSQKFNLILFLVVLNSVTMPSFATQYNSDDKKVHVSDTVDIEETLVVGESLKPNFEPTELTVKLMQTAGTFGDPLQSVFSLPGIVQIDEEDADPAVQGSSPNANLFLVDDMPVQFIFHPFGNSIFNENLIHDFGLNSAGFGARFGQATGAIFNVSLRDPRNQPLETTVDISFLRAGVLFEGGATETQSFYFSYRESLLPLYISENEVDEEEDITFLNAPRASDYQGKYYWQVGEKSSMTFQATGARDKAAANFGDESEDVLLDPGLEGDAKLDAEFHNQSVKWLHGNTKFLLGHSHDQEMFRIGGGEFLDLDQDTYLVKINQSWHVGKHLISSGAEANALTYDYSFNLRLDRCSDFSSDECDFDLGEPVNHSDRQKVNTYNVFIEDKWRINDLVDFTFGFNIGANDYLDETHIDPRMNVDWNIGHGLSANGSIGLYHQLPDVSEMFPVIGNPNLKSTQATHYVLGLNYDMGYSWKFDTTLYYKDIADLVVGVEEGEIPYFNEGEGKAYGLELMATKEKVDRWYGWASLSLSETERTDTLTGRSAPFSYDVPIVLNMVVNYQWTETWNVGIRWTYRSGTLYTPIIGNRENPDFPGFYIPVYGELNSERVSDFHRLDIRFERPIFNGSGLYYIDLLNAYGRENTSGIEYVGKPNSDEFTLRNIEGYGIIPSMGVKITF